MGSGKRLTRAKENTYWRAGGFGASHFLPHNPESWTASVLHSPILLVYHPLPPKFSHSTSPLAIPDSPPVMCPRPLLPSPHPCVPFCSCRLPVASPTGSLWRWGWWGNTWKWSICGWSPFQMADHKISSLPVLLHWHQCHVSASWCLVLQAYLRRKRREINHEFFTIHN